MSDLFLQTPNGQSELALQGDKPKMNKVNSVDQEAATKVSWLNIGLHEFSLQHCVVLPFHGYYDEIPETSRI